MDARNFVVSQGISKMKNRKIFFLNTSMNGAINGEMDGWYWKR